MGSFWRPLARIAPAGLSLFFTEQPKRSTSEQRFRRKLIEQVRLNWVEGLLDQSLYKMGRIELVLTDQSELVEQPVRNIARIPDKFPHVIPPNISIIQIFDEKAGALLILGGPGTGKTTLMLELARDLLLRADHDESCPLPVVFNLSSWGVRQPSLSEWILAELDEGCNVPEKICRKWLECDQILPLLDGLDEVPLTHRGGCVAAINRFRREHGLVSIAVSSRISDYRAIGTKLRLQAAVELDH